MSDADAKLRFHPLRLIARVEETAEVTAYRFAVPPALIPAYTALPGQFVTLEAIIGGRVERRAYSLCPGPADGPDSLRVAIRRLPGGAFSDHAHAFWREGEAVAVGTPQGRFAHRPDPAAAGLYAGFAAGSGITPVLAILRAVLEGEPRSRFILCYGNRRAETILFRREIEDLKDRFPARLAVLHVLSRESRPVPVLAGRLDAARLAALDGTVVPVARLARAFLCGPPGMLAVLAPALAARGLDPARILMERFTEGEALSERPPEATAVALDAVAEAEVRQAGRRHVFPVAGGETVLAAALRAGLDLPYSCRGGMCCTCRARVVAGEVAMAANYSLEPWELAAGFVLTCQSRPLTPHVSLDFDVV